MVQKKDGDPINELNKTISDDDLSDDDFFEKLIKTEVKPPTDDDDDDPSQKKADDDPANKNDDPTREELESKIALLEKEAKGRLTDTVKSRQERSQMKTELTTLKSAVSELLDKKKGKEEKTPEPLEDPKRKIEFTDDEKAFVDLSPVKQALDAQEEKTQKQIDEIKVAEANRVLQERYDSEVNKVLDVDRVKYDPAYKQLQVVIEALNNRVIEAQNRTNNLGDKKGSIDIDVALDLLDGSPEEAAFVKDFPGLNPIHIARAFHSKRDLKEALDSIIVTLEKGDGKADDDLDQKLIDAAKEKPGSLANQENQSGRNDSLIDKITNLKTEDILNISDAEAARIEKLLLDEEVRGD